MKVCVVGGGASGMAVAIRLARAGLDVTIMEKNDRLGKKILSTGNGKCNLGNSMISSACFASSDDTFMERFGSRFTTSDTLEFFCELGLMIKNKNGYLYPYGEQASIVLDVLRHALDVYGVKVLVNHSVQDILYLDNTNQFQVVSEQHRHIFDKVIVSTGGKAAPKTGSDGWGYDFARKIGHGLIPMVPALTSMKCKEDYFKGIAGVRAEALLSFVDKSEKKVSERGELQITANGISGIPVFQISRILNYMLKGKPNVPIHIDFFPDTTTEQIEEFIKSKKELYQKQTVEEFFTGFLNKKLMMLFIKLAGVKPTDLIADQPMNRIEEIIRLCKDWEVHVIPGATYDQAQVTAGGVPLSELNDDLESNIQNGIYFIGEVVDVDGICGGYNLHWAWCSAYIASEGILRG